VDRKLIHGLQHIWVIAWAEDLSLVTLPLGLIDGIDPVFHFHHHTAVLLDDTRSAVIAEEPLRVLQSERAVLTATAVNLEGLLISKDADGNAAEVTAQSGNWALLPPVERSVLVSVDKEASIISSAVCAAVTQEGWIREVCTNLLWLGPEIIHIVLLVRQNRAIRNQDTIGSDSLAGERHGKSMV